MLKRLEDNPIVRREDVRPSREGFEVYGAFNCGAAKVGEEYFLLMRVAERPAQEKGLIKVPILNEACDDVEVLCFRPDEPGLNASDPRLIVRADGSVLLTSISHLRLARSRDGADFKVDETPTIFPAAPYERYGIEDPRITLLDGRWWINYSAVSEAGVVTALISTTDWRRFERHGILFAPTDKDVCIFPEKVGGRCVCRHRPWAQGIGTPSIWTAYSGDLIHWGEHELTLAPRPGMWDEERVGCGPPPVRTERGWLDVYHGADKAGRYGLGALLTALDEPSRVIARSGRPILEPRAEYETHGVYAPCVFCNGLVAEEDGTLRIYYGAADTVVGGALTSVQELLAELR